MAQITFLGKPAQTTGNLPKVGEKLVITNLVKNDLSSVSLEAYKGKRKVLNIFPSVDTGVCATSVREFNKVAADLNNTVVLNLSLDLPFAQARFCGAEGIKNCETLSGFKSTMGKDLGLLIADTAFAGLYARAVIVLDADDKVIYTQLVSEISHEPDYKAALAVLA